jgi:hypothetical protein
MAVQDWIAAAVTAIATGALMLATAMPVSAGPRGYDLAPYLPPGIQAAPPGTPAPGPDYRADPPRVPIRQPDFRPLPPAPPPVKAMPAEPAVRYGKPLPSVRVPEPGFRPMPPAPPPLRAKPAEAPPYRTGGRAY